MKLFHKPPEFSIGIDFGTTITRLCYLDNRVSYQVVPTAEPIRSIVAPRQTKDKKWIWFSGESVLEKGLDHYSCFKLKMGCMEEITLEPSVQGGEPIRMRPEILAAHIIWVVYNKTCTVKQELDNYKNVTITIPAEWNAIQRQATVLAGRIAGFRNVHLIEEPIAAFLAINEFHPDDRLKRAKNTLVFDCGGGTLDITVIHRPDRSKWHVFGRRTEALPFVSGRDTNAGELAGEAIDQKLAAEVIGESNWKQMSPIDQRYLANIIRQLKESLNPKDRSKDPLHEASQSKVVILPDSKREFEPGTIRLTIGQLNRVAEEIAERAREIIQGALKSAGIHSSDIEAVVMVGGSSYLRPLQKVIATEFPKLEWGRGLYLEQPEEIVAIGAAMYQADLDHGRQRFGLRMPMETFLEYEKEVHSEYRPEKLTIAHPKENRFLPISSRWPKPIVAVPKGLTEINWPLKQKHSVSKAVDVIERIVFKDYSGRPDHVKLEYRFDRNGCLEIWKPSLILQGVPTKTDSRRLYDWIDKDPDELATDYSICNVPKGERKPQW